MAAVLAAVEPPYDGYRRTEAALQKYEQLTARGDGPKVAAVQKTRHGLTADGKLNAETIRQLNVLSDRMVQLDDALERWRWLPTQFPQPPIVVNIPEFVLRVFSADRKVALSMNVVVGRAVCTQTPVFAEDMKYIVFRPYWNVPPGIFAWRDRSGDCEGPGTISGAEDLR